jgi:hypothetical protein
LRHPETWEHGGVTYQAWSVRLGNDSPEGGRVTVDTLVGINRAASTVWFPNRVGIRFWGPGAQDAFDDPRIVISWLETASTVDGAVNARREFGRHRERMVRSA